MKYTAEYIWLGGNNELRGKTRVLDNLHFPDWNYDGSSTQQAEGHNSEVFIKPVYHCPDPFVDNGFIVLCATYNHLDEPLKNNHCHNVKNIFEQFKDQKPWYGLEQEYFLYDRKTQKPLGFPLVGNPNPQGQYYCSVGANNAFGRNIVLEHLQACLKANLKISGINAEVAPGQWEFQVGPVEGIDAAHQLWIARYLLERISEKYDVYVEWGCKPLLGDWNGSGCHCNFSTVEMREEGGLDVIYKSVEKLGEHHKEHMLNYGEGNEKRITGKHETASFNKFTWGIANRGASVRIGNDVVKNKMGYFEEEDLQVIVILI